VQPNNSLRIELLATLYTFLTLPYNISTIRRDYAIVRQQTMVRAMDLAMQEIKQNTFLKEKDKLLGFIRSRVSTVEEAEDILQDVFYQFVAGFEAIESIDRVTSWLYSVARNKIIDRYRRDAARPKRTDFETLSGKDEDSPLTLQEILPDLDNTPEATMLREAIWDEITEALDELPREQREIFIQNEIEEKSFREISEATGISINTLLSRKRYAIISLRKRLQKFYDDVVEN
jgi:RNA polymerase sigma factor (sigma-70 family)